MSEYKITSEHNGRRLDKFLVEKFQNQSRSQIQKKIKAGTVLINNEKPSVHQFLKTEDIIKIIPPRPAIPAESTRPKAKKGLFKIIKKLSIKKTKQKSLPLNIIADQPDYLVINKPAGLLVHEAPNHDELTLVDLVLKKYPAVKKIGEDPMRPGIVHRLDRDVSGLLVVAKTQDMFDHLKSQFKNRTIKKEYTALVYGYPQKNEGEISFNIGRSERTDHKMAAIPRTSLRGMPNNDRGKRAITKFELAEKIGHYSLLNVMPQTGRTHQIRVHLNAFGLPIVGDTTYKPKKLKTKTTMDRIFLHAHYLCFTDLSGNSQEFNSPLPAELQEILNNLHRA